MAERTSPDLIVMFDLGYSPWAISIPADMPVAITIDKVGSAVGNCTVDELGIRAEEIVGGNPGTVVMTAPAGTYASYSSVPGQRAAVPAGMLHGVAVDASRAGAFPEGIPRASLGTRGRG